MDLTPAESRSSNEIILAEWLEAVATFCIYYPELIAHKNKSADEQNQQQKSIASINLYEPNHFFSLIISMQAEIQQLMRNLEQLIACKQPTSKNWEALSNHTLILNQLNRQIKDKLPMQPPIRIE